MSGTENKTNTQIVKCGTVDGVAHLVEGSKPQNREDLVDLAREIQRADTSIKASASGKLRNILQQMRHLQEQAREVLDSTKRDADLHHAACNFKKIPGTIYHLYRRQSGQTYISMLSPDEWKTCPHEYLGSYKLEFDLTWTPVADLVQKEEDNAVIEKLINKSFKTSLTYT